MSLSDLSKNVDGLSQKDQKENRQAIAEVAGVEKVEKKDIENAEKVISGEKESSGSDKQTERRIALALTGVVPTILAGAIGGSDAGAITAQAASEQAKALAEGFAQEDAAEAAARAKKQKELTEREQKLADMNLQSANQKELEQLKQANRIQLAKMQQGKEKEPKATQYQAALFAKRIEQAEQNFQDLGREGVDTTSLSFAAQRHLPDVLKSEEVKRQEQAERNFVNAVLRRESGAAIADSEFDSAEKQYFPRPGDTPKVLEQKKVNRLIALKGLTAEAGTAAENINLPQISQEAAIETQMQKSRGAGGGMNLGTPTAIAAPPMNPLVEQYAKQHGLSPSVAENILKKRGAIQ